MSGWYVDDVAGGGGSPKAIPSGTVIPAGGRWVFEFASGFLNNTGAESVRFTDPAGTAYDSYDDNLSSAQCDKVFHRIGDGGAWCTTTSANATKGSANPSTWSMTRRVSVAVLLLGLSLTGCGGAPPGASAPRPDGRLVPS